MCGIFGFMTSRPDRNNFWIYNMLGIENQNRGKDSVGLVGVNKDNELQEEKKLIEFKDFMKEILLNKINFKFYEKNVVISHVRKASVGGINQDNIHPFVDENICLAHNGTIDNLEEVKAVTKENWDCDSKHLARLIKIKGNIEPAKGPATLVWYDTKTKKLNIIQYIRNIGVISNKNTIFFSSDEFVLNKINDYFFFGSLEKQTMFDKTWISAFIDKDNKLQISKDTCQWVAPAEYKKHDFSKRNNSFAKDDEYTIGMNPYFNRKKRKGGIVVT